MERHVTSLDAPDCTRTSIYTVSYSDACSTAHTQPDEPRGYRCPVPNLARRAVCVDPDDHTGLGSGQGTHTGTDGPHRQRGVDHEHGTDEGLVRLDWGTRPVELLAQGQHGQGLDEALQQVQHG